MIRNAQNSGQTAGMVSFAACDLLGRRLARIVDVALAAEREAEISPNGPRTVRAFPPAGVVARLADMVISAS
jgi:hypothetical protein